MATQIERDLGWNRIKHELSLLDGAYTKVGLQEGDSHKDDRGLFESVAAIGAIQEFGAKNIPRRSFLSAALEENAGKLTALKAKLLDSIYKGVRDAHTALALLGQTHEDQVKAKIVAGPWTPLALSTIRARMRRSTRLNSVFSGEAKPLVDTNQMRQSVRHVEVIES